MPVETRLTRHEAGPPRNRGPVNDAPLGQSYMCGPRKTFNAGLRLSRPVCTAPRVFSLGHIAASYRPFYATNIQESGCCRCFDLARFAFSRALFLFFLLQNCGSRCLEFYSRLFFASGSLLGSIDSKSEFLEIFELSMPSFLPSCVNHHILC